MPHHGLCTAHGLVLALMSQTRVWLLVLAVLYKKNTAEGLGAVKFCPSHTGCGLLVLTVGRAGLGLVLQQLPAASSALCPRCWRQVVGCCCSTDDLACSPTTNACMHACMMQRNKLVRPHHAVEMGITKTSLG